MTTLVERALRVVGTDRSRALRRLPLITLVLDAGVVTAVGALALWGREQLPYLQPAVGVHEQLGYVGPAMIGGLLAMIALAGGYQREIFGGGTDEFVRVLRACLLTAALVGIGSYLAYFDLSRGFFALSFILAPPLLLLGRWLLRKVLHALRRHGHLQVRIVVSGTPAHIDEVWEVLERERWLGYQVIGAVTHEDNRSSETLAGVPILGSAANAALVARVHEADIIFFAAGSLSSAQEMREQVWALEDAGINVVIAPSLDDISSERIKVRPVGGLPLIHVDRPTWANAANLSKRLFDLVGASVLILALSPVLVVAAAQIWLNDRGPILYRQIRVGQHGKEFSCLKFRTMVEDADSLIANLIADSGSDALLFKMRDDPRITRPGKWLRRFSVDELPQLFNVWRGDMSLVGPRPQVQREVDLYEGGMSRRLLVRPGMTGLWQVSGRSDLSAKEAMRLDLFYVDNWSLLQDIHILTRTAGAVFSSRGAY